MSDTTSEVKQVYAAISKVQGELAKEGIGKANRNTQQGFMFRGIDDVYNALAPILAKHGLVIMPRIIARDCLERQTKSGGALFYVTVTAEFDFVSAVDGSIHTARTYGEAMDSADKATNKAMSAAYKYVCLQTFAIPTEGDNDADAHTPEVAPAAATPPKAKPTPKAQPSSDKPVYDWREELVPYTKYAGKPLGSFSAEQVEWFYTESRKWEPVPADRQRFVTALTMWNATERKAKPAPTPTEQPAEKPELELEPAPF